jgi:hypothetical protein
VYCANSASASASRQLETCGTQPEGVNDIQAATALELRSSIFDDLSTSEISAVVALLLDDSSLGLVPSIEAQMNQNYISYMERFAPKKVIHCPGVAQPASKMRNTISYIYKYATLVFHWQGTLTMTARTYGRLYTLSVSVLNSTFAE